MRIGSRYIAREKLGQCHHSLCLFVNAAELRMEHAVFERLDPRLERHSPIVVPKETRVGEAGTQHAFISSDNGPTSIDSNIVGDEQKARGRCAVGPEAGEILLMRA